MPNSACRAYGNLCFWQFLIKAVRLAVAAVSLALAGAPMRASAEEPITELLKAEKFTELDERLSTVQKKFEAGTLGEIELRNAFRPFYNLRGVEAEKLRTFAAAASRSYVAHLALGIYFKRRGLDARGETSWRDVPFADRSRMESAFEDALKELKASLPLTPKPYLSAFHLLHVAVYLGQQQEALVLLREGNKMLPDNGLIRGRYATSLTPRWGGSYQQLDRFIAETKSEGAPPSVLLQLDAIREDDIGLTFWEQHDRQQAEPRFERALELAKQVGGSFAEDFLPTSLDAMCRGTHHSPLCP